MRDLDDLWHRIPAGQPLLEDEIDYVLRVLTRWLTEQTGDRPAVIP